MLDRTKANRKFRDAGVERFYSVKINRTMNPSDAVDLGHPCNCQFEFQVVHRYIFIVVSFCLKQCSMDHDMVYR